VLGAWNTLLSAKCLATYIMHQGKHAESEAIQREVLGARKRVFGAEHPHTLAIAGDRALSLMHQGKDAEEHMRHPRDEAPPGGASCARLK
jgi:hypothetical protein